MSPTVGSERVSARLVDKFAARRDELAAATRTTLSELGYARTSLREIAANSAFSHGVLHYYFRDKVDLITHSVRQYKAECVSRYDEIVASSVDGDELAVRFAQAMATTLVDDAAMHRLWYDLRNQSMFDDAFRTDVAEIDAGLEGMIWRVVSRYTELTGTGLVLSSTSAYAVFDGLFLQALGRYTTDPTGAAAELEIAVERLLRQIVTA
ncbi:TetR/AcrR family transcriptional regulator [Sporichthya sp.]|uniref:TetR/AcrR family transcriptional regulator n=1 Tax=Sporichthya sp. TaxID=65475 RepID=UPI00182C55EB|nr:TetR/AcrR family transcriptional regulator [Sporichthya sp.]MBA3743679.1 TetR/AcrR family transcriptional regulator [Sporichthya sp.]